jgi:hypothetical protein
MRFPFINDPKTDKPSEMVTIVMMTTTAAVARFLVDGVSINIEGHVIAFGHIDAMVYASILAPILGAHSFIGSKKKEEPKNEEK